MLSIPRLFLVPLFLFVASGFGWQTLLAQNSNFSGYWEDELEVGNIKMRLGLTFAEEDGVVRGSLLSISQGEVEIPFSKCEVSENSISIETEQSQIEFVGELSEDGESINGQFKQGPVQQEMSFAKKESPYAKWAHTHTWRGELDAGVEKKMLQLRIYNDQDDELRGRLDDMSVGGVSFPIDIDAVDDKFNFKLIATAAKFEGEFNESRNKIAGTWMQSGQQIDLEFEQIPLDETWLFGEQAEKPQAPNRPQTPTEPFPYQAEDVTFRNEAAAITLAGTLTTPKGDGPFPAVVLVSGSGPQDRDETLLGHKPFLVLADFLTRHGIAVLRYDDRGCFESEGDFADATSEDFAGDAVAAIEFLSQRNEIDADKIGLCGHSEGGLIAPMAANRTDKISFIVMMAGPGVDGAEILRNQIPDGIKLAGGSEAGIQGSLAFVNAFVEAASKHADKIPQEVLEQITDEFREAVAEGNLVDKVLPDQMAATLSTLDTKWTRFFLQYDPGSELRKVQCDVLAINGEKDVQVAPQMNLKAIEKALAEGGNSNVTIKELAGLNHLFQNCTTGAGAEYALIEETFAPEALELIRDWIQNLD